MNGSIVELQFLVDYENIREAGLDGAEYLYHTDTLAIFYSSVCPTVSRKTMDLILKSACEFQQYKLKKSGKNALDFYIVSRVGELLGSGYSGKLVIISRDKGYSAMRDYWLSRGISGERILLKHSIREGIIASNENTIRRKQILKETAQVGIEQEHARYEERKCVKSRVMLLFEGTEYEDTIGKICELAEEEKRPRDLYLGSLKRFGKADGTKIYRYLRQERV